MLSLGTLASASSGTYENLPPSSNPGIEALSQVVARNASLHDYTFDVDVHIALLTFPWIRFTLKGHGEYTRDGVYAVHFDHMPWFGRGFETISMTSLDPSTWPEQYMITLAKERSKGNDIVLSLHDRKKSPLLDTQVTIAHDKSVREIRWTYLHGGYVHLNIEPSVVSGYLLPAAESADIVMAAYHATASATFSNYRVNTAQSAVRTTTATPPPPS